MIIQAATTADAAYRRRWIRSDGFRLGATAPRVAPRCLPVTQRVCQ